MWTPIPLCDFSPFTTRRAWDRDPTPDGPRIETIGSIDRDRSIVEPEPETETETRRDDDDDDDDDAGGGATLRGGEYTGARRWR